MSELDRQQADRHKHLDHVQAIVSRLANNSFLMKGWSLTVAAALTGYALTKNSVPVALAALVPAVAFWFLDAYYLRQERAFRLMYDAIGKGDVPAFEIRPKSFLSLIAPVKTALSITLTAFYGVLVVVSLAAAIVVAATGDDADQQHGSHGKRACHEMSEMQLPLHQNHPTNCRHHIP